MWFPRKIESVGGIDTSAINNNRLAVIRCAAVTKAKDAIGANAVAGGTCVRPVLHFQRARVDGQGAVERRAAVVQNESARPGLGEVSRAGERGGDDRIAIHGDGRVINHHEVAVAGQGIDRKSTRLNSSHLVISYAVFCLNKKT